MGSNNPFGGEGSSINRPPLFNGEGYAYWKVKMKIFIEAMDVRIWDAIENGPYIPKTRVNDEIEDKPRGSWDDDDIKKASYDLKGKNIITSALSHDEFFRISQCKTSKEMWDILQVTHEGTSEVRRARLNTLIHEYELFRMLPNEGINDLQKRFTHIINHLMALGKTFHEGETINKVLRCLDRRWQPKVTAIMESKNLDKMELATLFGKLQEHEMELSRLGMHEESDKKKKGIALQASTKGAKEEEECSTNEDSDHEELKEELGMLVKRFNKFYNNKKGNFPSKERKSKEFHPKKKISKEGIKCHECGGNGHIKFECPTYLKKNDKKTHETKGKKAYITWDPPEKEDSSSSSSSGDEVANLCLMARNNNTSSSKDKTITNESDDEVVSSYSCSNSNDTTIDTLQQAYDELLKHFKKLVKVNDTQAKKILEFEQTIVENQNSINELKLQIEKLEVINSKKDTKQKGIVVDCERCSLLEKEVKNLNTKMHLSNSNKNLDRLLASQRNSSIKTGLGYVHKKPQKNKVVGSFSKIDYSKKPTCFYCGKFGHTNNKCHIKRFGIKNGTYMWVVKGESSKTNQKGPNIIWVPKMKK